MVWLKFDNTGVFHIPHFLFYNFLGLLNNFMGALISKLCFIIWKQQGDCKDRANYCDNVKKYCKTPLGSILERLCAKTCGYCGGEYLKCRSCYKWKKMYRFISTSTKNRLSLSLSPSLSHNLRIWARHFISLRDDVFSYLV